MTHYWILIIVLWLLLGIHSATFCAKHLMKGDKFTSYHILALIICILLPIITHAATILTVLAFYEKKK